MWRQLKNKKHSPFNTISNQSGNIGMVHMHINSKLRQEICSHFFLISFCQSFNCNMLPIFQSALINLSVTSLPYQILFNTEETRSSYQQASNDMKNSFLFSKFPGLKSNRPFHPIIISVLKKNECIPWLKSSVAATSSEKEKFFQEDLKQQDSGSRDGFVGINSSLILLLFLLVSFGTFLSG